MLCEETVSVKEAEAPQRKQGGNSVQYIHQGLIESACYKADVIKGDVS